MAEEASHANGLATLIAHPKEIAQDQLADGPCDGAGAMTIPLIHPLMSAIVSWVSPSAMIQIVHLNAMSLIRLFLPLSAVAGRIDYSQTAVNQMAAGIG